jgi:hypothetical protein
MASKILQPLNTIGQRVNEGTLHYSNTVAEG